MEKFNIAKYVQELNTRLKKAKKRKPQDASLIPEKDKSQHPLVNKIVNDYIRWH